MKDWRDPSASRALFVSEIVTISLLGRTEDLEQLETLLDESSTEDLKRALIELADAIRSRHDMGLSKDCCAECQRFEKCELKWLKTERNLRPTCCPRCSKFQQCLRGHQDQERSDRRESDPPGTL